METIFIDSRSKANGREINAKVRNAEALFIAGGNQAHYYEYWEDTDLAESVNWLAREKKIPIGGTSSGCNVLGGIYVSALYGAIGSADAMNDPYQRKVDLRYGTLFNLPTFENAALDPHFSNPDRMGRLVTFLARAIVDRGSTGMGPPFGIGIGEMTAVAVDEYGHARVFSYGDTDNEFGYAHFIQAQSDPEEVKSRSPLDFYGNRMALRSFRVRGTVAGEHGFMLNEWRGRDGLIQDIAVDRGRHIRGELREPEIDEEPFR